MSRVGGDLVEAFAEMAAHLRGETEAVSYEAPENLLTPEKIKSIRRKMARSKQVS